MLKALLRVRLLALFYWFTGGSRSRKKPGSGRLVLYALLMLYVFGCFAFLAWGIFSSMSAVFAPLGLGAAYFALVFLMAFALMFLGSVFTAKSSLFEAKDTELLLSLPLTPGMILTSRLLPLIGVNLLLGALIALPGALCWQTNAPPGGMGWAAFLLILAGVALFATAVSALFGWLLSRLSGRIRHKSLVTSGLSILFLAVYFVFIGRMQNIINEFITNGASIAGKLASVQPLMWLGDAAAEGDALSLVKSLLLLVLPFVLACRLLSRSYIRTVTSHRGFARTEYREKRAALHSPARALLSRELIHFGQCSSYLVNCGLGAILLVGGGIALLFAAGRITELLTIPELAELMQFAPAVGALAICAVAGLSPLTAPAISLEGRTLWLLRSMPVSPREIFLSKLKLHLTVMCPSALVSSVCMLIVLRPTHFAAAALILLPQAYILLTGILGLWENLRHPSLDWTTETQAVKSGIGLLFTMLIGFAMLLTMAALLFLGGKYVGADTALLLLCPLAALSAGLLWRLVLRRGTALWESLS